MNIANRHQPGSVRSRLVQLWPQVPLAIVVAMMGAFNVLNGLSLPLTVLHQVRALNGLADTLSAVGGTAQVILGSMLVIAGLGLLRRFSFAWTLSVWLLAISLGINVAQRNLGVGIILQAGLLAALWYARHCFTRRTVLASMLLSLSSILAVLTYGTIGSLLLKDDFRPKIHGLSDACYFTVVSLSTVGYGDIVPTTTASRWFAISLLVVGLGVFASAIASALGPKLAGEFARLFDPKEKIMEIKNHVILAGQGAIARNTAKELQQRGVRYVHIVTTRPEAADTAEELVIEGDPTDDAVLRQAGIEHARMVIAAREDDGENAFIALVAKDLNPKVRLLAVASSALAIRRLKLARADLVFSPAAVGSRLLADLVQGNQISSAFQDLLEGALPYEAEENRN